jgi:hypothetical protein
MNVVAIPIIESNTELQGARHSSMTARDVGGTTDRNSLRARQANGAAMLVEVDAAAVAVLLLVMLIAEVREVVRRLLVRKEVEQPQKLAVNAPRGRHARGQERQRPIASIRLPVAADLVSGGLVKELVGPIQVAQRAVAEHITRISDEVVAHGDIDHQIVLAHKVSTHNVEVCPAMAITGDLPLAFSSSRALF